MPLAILITDIVDIFQSLTLWEPGYDIFVLWNRPKTSSCQLPYQHPSSSADCTRELFKGSNGSASHLGCTQKKFFGWGLQIFCDWRHKWSRIWAILANVAWPRAQPLSLKFSFKTRLESESFEPLINFLAFLVQKLWSKTNNLSNYLIIKLVKNFFNSDHNFLTWNPSRASKVSKDSDCSLVSSKNFSKILPSNDWCPGPGEVGQGGLKVLHLWRHSQKTRTPQPKNFFQVQTIRLTASFDTSTRSLTRTGVDIFPHTATCDPAVFLRTNSDTWINPDVKVLGS